MNDLINTIKFLFGGLKISFVEFELQRYGIFGLINERVFLLVNFAYFQLQSGHYHSHFVSLRG